MNKKIKKNQHLVSQFIQKQFSNENKKIYGIKEIELINDGSIKYEINKFSITNTMCKKDSYELPNISLNYLENEFSKIESKYVSIYNELVLLIEKKDSYKKIKEYITNKCMPYFLWFYYRTYQFTLLGLEEENTNLQQKQKLLRFKDTLFDSKYLYELSKTILNCYNMYILESTSEDFLLSDCYLCTASTNFKGYYSSDYRIWSNRLIGLKNMLILIPINAKYYILFTDDPSFFIENNFKKNHYIKIYKNNIWRYNSIIYRNSYEFTVGKHLETLKKINSTVTKYVGKFNYSNDSIDKKEVWVDEKIDKEFCYPTIIFKGDGFYGFNMKYQLEKPIDKKSLEQCDFKIVTRR